MTNLNFKKIIKQAKVNFANNTTIENLLLISELLSLESSKYSIENKKNISVVLSKYSFEISKIIDLIIEDLESGGK